MIAPAVLPSEYQSWNAKWHAPFGRTFPVKGPISWSLPALWFRGPFSVQPNSSTRVFEYPWAHQQVIERLPKGGTVLEIGGGLAGLQWVLAREGYNVVNVDPGMEAQGHGWFVTPKKHRVLSRLFKAPVSLIPTPIEQAHLPAQSVDLLLCVSTLEHLTPSELSSAAASIKEVLKPGGVAVLTIDLFLDVFPFTDAPQNRWGTNINVFEFLGRAGLQLVKGDPRQIFGFPEFDAKAIASRQGEFLIGGDGIAMAQCLVARRA